MTDTPPTRPARAGKIALVLAIVSLLVSLGSCLVTTVGDIGLPVQSKAVAADAGQVEAVAHVTLPPGAVLLSAAYSNGLETRLSAKFRFARSSLDAFLAAGKFGTAPVPGLRVVTAAHNVGGGNLWDPEKPVTVSGVGDQTADGTYRRVLFDLDAPEWVTVYLHAGRG